MAPPRFGLPFRPEALRAMRSPAQLDDVIQITSPLSWLALTILSAAVAGALAWGVFGTYSTRVQGEGLLAYEGARYIHIVSPVAGYLSQRDADVGDRLAPGDRVARMEVSGGSPSRVLDIRAQGAGEIVEVLAGVGQFVRAGEPLYRMTDRVSALSAIAFMAGSEAGRIEPGMPVLVSPDLIDRREFGSLRGVVREVSRSGLSPEALHAMLGNRWLVERFSRSGAPLVIGIDLVESAAGGHVWTTGRMPQVDVKLGMLASVNVTIRQQPPITLGIPLLGRWLEAE